MVQSNAVFGGNEQLARQAHLNPFTVALVLRRAGCALLFITHPTSRFLPRMR
jgi:hypothetical protein